MYKQDLISNNLQELICRWCWPKVGTMEGKHGTQVRGKKDILTKVTKDSVRVSGAYYPVVSNIGSRTTTAFIPI